MAVYEKKVEVGNLQNTHHLTLDDGTTEMGLLLSDPSGQRDWRAIQKDPMPGSGIQFFQGQPEYGDYAPPWTPTQITTADQGRGAKVLEKEKGAFFDSYRCDTTKEGLICVGGQDVWMDGIGEHEKFWPFREVNDPIDRADITVLVETKRAVKFTTSTAIADTDTLIFALRYDLDPGTSTDPGDLRVSIFNDSGGSPGSTEVAYKVVSTSDLTAESMYEIIGIELSSGSLTISTDYWVVWSYPTGAATAQWKVAGVTGYTGAPTSKNYLDGVGWGSDSAGTAPMFILIGDRDDFKGHFFDYKGAKYCVKEMDDGDQASLWINGDRGVADVNASSSILEDGTKSWTADEWIGSLVLITAGTGTNQVQRWRMITDNDATTLTVSPAWGEKPDTTTEYVIRGSNKWTELDTTSAVPTGGAWGSSSVVTSVTVCNGIIYFCHGDNVAMTSVNYYNNSGTWTAGWVTETDNLGMVLNGVDQDGGFILGVKQGIPSQFVIADQVDGTAASLHSALTFGDEQTDWDVGERAKAIVQYGEWGELVVIKEGGAYKFVNRQMARFSPAEMNNFRDDRNGQAVTVHGVYLEWSFYDAAVRYFRNNLDGIDPNKASNPLPGERRGHVSAMVSGMGEVYYAIDGGNDGYSSILVHNGFGFHEFYRAPCVGLRIHGMGVDALPGINVDWIMFSCGSNIIKVPISKDPTTHPQRTNHQFYPFTFATSHVVFPWIYNNRRAVDKLYKDIQIVASCLAAVWLVGIWYKLDDDTTWTYLGTVGSWKAQASVLSSDYTTRGSRIQIMIGLETYENEYSPIIEAIVLNSFMKVNKTWGYTITALVEDGAKDLDGTTDENLSTFATKNAKLEEWDESPIAVYVKGGSEFVNGKYCVLDMGSYRVLENLDDGKYLVQLRLVELG